MRKWIPLVIWLVSHIQNWLQISWSWKRLDFNISSKNTSLNFYTQSRLLPRADYSLGWSQQPEKLNCCKMHSVSCWHFLQNSEFLTECGLLLGAFFGPKVNRAGQRWDGRVNKAWSLSSWSLPQRGWRGKKDIQFRGKCPDMSECSVMNTQTSQPTWSLRTGDILGSVAPKPRQQCVGKHSPLLLNKKGTRRHQSAPHKGEIRNGRTVSVGCDVTKCIGK